MNALQWVLVDYVNVVVHIFHPETRKFYRLEEMWSDAAAADHEQCRRKKLTSRPKHLAIYL
jgi:ribosomal silencing factor RsfS